MTARLPGGWALGPELGRGGTAVVYAAERDGVRAAVKVLAAPLADRQGLVDALRTEIRVAASLDHPAVVRVLDAGDVPAGLGLPEGAPYVVVERAEGTLADLPPTDGRGVREALSALLAALAHAHARGVLHRDVKPANLLRVTRDGAPAWALADFGLSFDQRVERRGVRGGTPGFSPPEQLAGDPVEGPWTDLHAVGVTAWSLLRGRLPGPDGPGPDELPDGPAGDWLRWLVDPDPSRRPDHAVAAAHGLAALADAELTPGAGAPPDRETWSPTGETVRWDTVAPAPRWAASGGGGPGLSAWRRPSPTDLREAQEACWAVVLDAVRSREPRVLWITAEADGVGCSTLADWVTEQAAELGLVEPIRVEASALQVPQRSDVAACVLGVEGASDDVVRRAGRRAGHPDLEAVLDLVRPFREGARSRSIREWDLLLADLFERRAGGRVPLLRLDDAQWAAEPLRFVLGDLPGPRLTVLTGRVGVEGDALAQSLLERMAADPRVTLVTLRRPPVAPVAAWDAAVTSLDGDARSALEALAVMGGPTIEQRWDRVVALGGGRLAAGLPVLLDRGLVRRTRQGWALVHAMVAERVVATLLPDARTAWHRHCAEVLSGGWPTESLGLHLLRAGRRLDAARVLARIPAPDVSARLVRCDRVERWLALDPPDAVSQVADLIRLELLALRGGDDVAPVAARLRAWASGSDDPVAPYVLAYVDAVTRDSASAERAIEAMDRDGGPPEVFFSLVAPTIWHKLRSDVLRDLGRTDEAIAACRTAAELAPNAAFRAFGLLSVAGLQLIANPEDARDTLEEASRQAGAAMATVHAQWLQLRSALLLWDGDVDEAADLLARSIEVRASLGVGSPYGSAALASLRVLQGRLDEAEALVVPGADRPRAALAFLRGMEGAGDLEALTDPEPDVWGLHARLPAAVADALDAGGRSDAAARIRARLPVDAR